MGLTLADNIYSLIALTRDAINDHYDCEWLTACTLVGCCQTSLAGSPTTSQ